jgi:hypothetical protein
MNVVINIMKKDVNLNDIQQYRQCTCNETSRRFRESLLPWKSKKYYIFMCVSARLLVHVALLTQHATRTRHIVTYFVAPLAPPNFSTLSH